MSDLIDREALKAAHGLGTDCGNCKQSARSCQYDRDFSRMDFCEWIDDAPIIEAVPVVHGEWKPFDLTYGRSVYSCSVCEQATEVPMCMEKPMYAYCPNCGARMDGGKDAVR